VVNLSTYFFVFIVISFGQFPLDHFKSEKYAVSDY